METKESFSKFLRECRYHCKGQNNLIIYKRTVDNCNCIRPRVGELSGPCGSEWDILYMCGEREEAFLQASEPLTPISAALGSHRALRQPEERRPPHILDALLQGLNPFSHRLFCVSRLTAICHMRHAFKADLGRK